MFNTKGVQMRAEIKKWGNSAGVLINKELLGQFGASIGDAVNVDVVEGGLLIQLRDTLTLEELLAKSPPQSFNILPEDEAWINATPVGKEA